MHTLNIKGKIYTPEGPGVMGILNITDDSFYDGGRHNSIEKAFVQAMNLIQDGADMLDVGGYSSRPGAGDISIGEELERVIPVIERIRAETDIIISIDTFRSGVASEAVKSGASMVNDISAGDDDPKMIALVAELKVPYIAMHKRGKPATMHQNPSYDSVHLEVMDYLLQKKRACLDAGVVDLIIDPGFGFGKNIAHNYELLANLHIFRQLNIPMLVGLSRKSMIYKVLKTTPEEALNGTTFLHAFALMGGAEILRVHDVKAAVECIKLFRNLSPYLC